MTAVDKVLNPIIVTYMLQKVEIKNSIKLGLSELNMPNSIKRNVKKMNCECCWLSQTNQMFMSCKRIKTATWKRV